MLVRLVRRLLLVSIAAAGLVACDSGVLSGSKEFLQCLFDLPPISNTIAGTAGYSKNDVDVTGNRTRLEITIVDPSSRRQMRRLST